MLLSWFIRRQVKNLAESFVDNVIRDRVSEPKPGSVVYCDLAGGCADHSGIYVGADAIVHLDGSGLIEQVTPKQFINRLGGLNAALSIYVSCNGTASVGSKDAARRAKSMVGRKRQYNLVTDNCHQFAAGCLTGDFNANACNFLWMLKQLAEERIQADSWRVWDIDAS